MRQSQLVPALTACLLASTSMASPRIEQIAPESSAIVVSIENWETITRNIKATQLWQIWEAPELAETRAEMKKAYEQGLKDMFQELGVEGESLPTPTGPVGLAVFPILNDELGVNEAAYLLCADFGANADKMAGLIDAAIKKGEKDGRLVYDEKKVLGRTVFTLKIKHPERPEVADGDGPGQDDMGDEGFNELEGMVPMLDPEKMMEKLSTLNYVRDGATLMLSSSATALTDALEVSDGAAGPGGSSVGKNLEFQKIVARLGASDAWLVVLIQNIGKIFPAGENMMMATGSSMLKTAFGEVAGAGLGVRFDAPKAMLQGTWFISMPSGKSGLTALLDTQTPRGDLPPFVGGDAIAYSRINFEFDGLMAAIRGFIRSNQMLQMQVGEEGLAEIEPIVQQIAAALQPEMHFVSTLTRPITLGSMSSLLAARCSQPEQINTLLAANAAAMAMQPRDFLGHTIYSMDPDVLAMMMRGGPPPGMESGISIATGGGYVFGGSTSAVEQALRSTDQTGAAKREPDPMFRRVAAALPETSVVAWGFNSIVDQLEAEEELAKLMMKKRIEEAKQFDPEYGKELEKEMAEAPSKTLDKLDYALLRRHLGPMAWTITAPDDGMLGTMYLLGPSE